MGLQFKRSRGKTGRLLLGIDYTPLMVRGLIYDALKACESLDSLLRSHYWMYIMSSLYVAFAKCRVVYS